MNKLNAGLVAVVLLPLVPRAFAQRQMEPLGRGVVAVRTGTSTVYVGWRWLAPDPENIGFNVLRSANGGALVQVNGALLTTSCNFTDNTINFAQSNAYFLQPVAGGVAQALSAPFGLAANPPHPAVPESATPTPRRWHDGGRCALYLQCERLQRRGPRR